MFSPFQVANIKREIAAGVAKVETIQKFESKRDHINEVKKERDEKRKQMAKLEQARDELLAKINALILSLKFYCAIFRT